LDLWFFVSSQLERHPSNIKTPNPKNTSNLRPPQIGVVMKKLQTLAPPTAYRLH
jgi:hypothetical protein